MRFVLIGAICGSMLLSGCRLPASRPFDQIEREMNESPVRATFSIPPPCEYIPSPLEPSALVGTWSVSGTMDGVDYSPRYIPPKRWSAAWGKSFTFFADGTYSNSDTFNGRQTRATGRWSYSHGVLVLDIDGNGKTNTHREYRLLWLDNRTFDLRWTSDAVEAAWWKDWVLDRGNYAGWDNSVVVSYDQSGCKRQTSRMRKGKTGVIYDVLYPPLRYKSTGGGAAADSGLAPVAGSGESKSVPEFGAVPSKGAEGAGSSSAIVEVDSIPL